MKLASLISTSFQSFSTVLVVLSLAAFAACSKDGVLPHPENSNIVEPWQYELVLDTNHIRNPGENVFRSPVSEIEEGAPNPK